ncbi:MAG: nucleotidyl transferase AbiEii/AbiGii toxin family protein [Actinobacteria bacterium]|nr:nucleotidyl transferase AbiEii/AbiGii toxin family protein [Actinomycetota bacterium]
MLELEQIESFYPENLRSFKKNILREYLQYKILDIIFDSVFGSRLVFMGGTALRIIYGNKRFSEDLDFDNLGLDLKDFETLSDIIQKKISLEGYETELSVKKRGAYITQLKIKNLLYDYDLTSHSEQKIIIGIDAESQGFDYKADNKIINKFDVFTMVNVVPKDILLSQKIFSVLNRNRILGRDLYDIIFLLGMTKPNKDYLISKIGKGDIESIKKLLISKTSKLNIAQISHDVKAFLFDQPDLKKIELFSEYIKNL